MSYLKLDQHSVAQQYMYQGRIQGGGGLGVGTPPPPFWGTPKLHKEGKNVARKRRVLVLNSYLDPPPPFQNPVSAPALYTVVPVPAYYHCFLITSRIIFQNQ